MKHFSLTITTLVAAILMASTANALTCKQWESKESENDGNQYFQDDEQTKLSATYEEQILRKASAAWMGSDYNPKMSLKKLKELGEDSYTGVVKDPNGKTYALANIGFGGGNSVSYYFELNKLDFTITVTDGSDCEEPGTSAHLPIEKDVVPNQKVIAKCEITKGEGPISKFEFRVPTYNGTYLGSLSQARLEYNHDFDKTEAAVKGSKSSWNPEIAATVSKTKKGIFLSVGQDLKDEESKRMIDFSARVKDGKAEVSGKAYTDKTGGYWADDAVDFESSGSCEITGEIKDVKFMQIVKY